MKNWEDMIWYAVYALFGAGLGFLVYAMALGGWTYLFLDQEPRPWSGLVSLILCVGIGGGLGGVAYAFRDREYGNGLFENQDVPNTILITKRVIVLVSCAVAFYFIWSLARKL